MKTEVIVWLALIATALFSPWFFFTVIAVLGMGAFGYYQGISDNPKKSLTASDRKMIGL